MRIVVSNRSYEPEESDLSEIKKKKVRGRSLEQSCHLREELDVDTSSVRWFQITLVFKSRLMFKTESTRVC
jgi:hypothetical protein